MSEPGAHNQSIPRQLLLPHHIDDTFRLHSIMATGRGQQQDRSYKHHLC